MTTNTNYRFASFVMSSTDLSKAIGKAVTKLNTASDDIQACLLAIAFQVEKDNNCDGLTKLVKALSSENSKGETVLSSHAKQLGLYAQDALPVQWDKDSQSFKLKLKLVKAHDWDKALVKLATRWDKFNNQKADDGFDAVGKLRSALAAIAAIIDADTTDIDPRVLEAARILQSNTKTAANVLAEIKAEKAALRKTA